MPVGAGARFWERLLNLSSSLLRVEYALSDGMCVLVGKVSGHLVASLFRGCVPMRNVEDSGRDFASSIERVNPQNRGEWSETQVLW